MSNQHKILLAAIATADYLDKAKQLFSSAYEAGYWQGDYMLLTKNLNPNDRHWFESRGILVREYDDVLTEEIWGAYPSSKSFHRIILERLHLFRPEFKQWDVITYMDCDIIVVGPLVRLEKTTGFASTLDSGIFLGHNILPDFRRQLQDDGYNLNTFMFCSGMFAFHTKIIESDTYEKLMQLIKRYMHATKLLDQVVLNLLFYKKWKRLSMAYGYMLTTLVSGYFQRPKGAIALHFAYNKRPWDPQSPYYALWLENLQKAETIDFTKAKRIDASVRREAFYKEHFFIPWVFWLTYPQRSWLRKNHSTKPWYIFLKKIRDQL